MEDNSYVNLSLKKYNELYDKAKKFDELNEELTDEIVEQPKEYNSDTVHIGDKVLIKHDLNKINNFACDYVPEMKEFEGKVVTVDGMASDFFEFKEDTKYKLKYDYRSIEKIISRN